MFEYKVLIDYTPADGPFDVYVQYINANEYELVAQNKTQEQMMTGISLTVNTKLLNIRIVNVSQCCSAEQTINAANFEVI